MTIRIPSPTIASAISTSMATFADRIFWATTTRAITDIQAMLMTPSATNTSIKSDARADATEPELEPTRTPSRQRRRMCCLRGVSS